MSWQMEMLFCASPETLIDPHVVFNLATLRTSGAYDDAQHAHELQVTVAAGFELLGLGHTGVSAVWRDAAATKDALEAALSPDHLGVDEQGVLRTCWNLRRELLRFPMRWRHVIEGNPVRMALAGGGSAVPAIAAEVLDIASRSIGAVRAIDGLILGAYGAPAPPVVTYRDLAVACPQAVALNGGWYDAADFGLSTAGARR